MWFRSVFPVKSKPKIYIATQDPLAGYCPNPPKCLPDPEPYVAWAFVKRMAFFW